MRSRSDLTRETRRVLASRSLLSGCASGSASVALRTSASDIAFRRAQSVAPLRLPDFAVTRVVSVFLTFCRFPSRNNAARIFLTISHNNKEHVAARHSDHDVALFVLVKAVVGVFRYDRDLQGRRLLAPTSALRQSRDSDYAWDHTAGKARTPPMGPGQSANYSTSVAHPHFGDE